MKIKVHVYIILNPHITLSTIQTNYNYGFMIFLIKILNDFVF